MLKSAKIIVILRRLFVSCRLYPKKIWRHRGKENWWQFSRNSLRSDYMSILRMTLLHATRMLLTTISWVASTIAPSRSLTNQTAQVISSRRSMMRTCKPSRQKMIASSPAKWADQILSLRFWRPRIQIRYVKVKSWEILEIPSSRYLNWTTSDDSTQVSLTHSTQISKLVNKTSHFRSTMNSTVSSLLQATMTH